MRLFSPDSKFMRAMSRLGDMMLLNVVYLLTCIPLFTIGAASAALYTVTFAMDTPREGKLLRGYFAAFRLNFRQATVIWLILLACCAIVYLDLRFFSAVPGALSFLSLLFIAMLLLLLLVASFVFPLLSRFQNSTVGTLKNALALSIGYLPRSLLMAAINLLPFVLLVMDLFLFLNVGFIWVALYFSAAAYFNTRLLKKVFAPFEGEERKDEV